MAKPKPKRVIVIDAEKQEIRESEIHSLEGMQKLVGGYIALACPIGKRDDEVYVNDEGLLGSPQHFFWVYGQAHPFALNGFIIGAPNSRGDNTDCKMSVDEARKLITFMDINAVRAAVNRGEM